MLILDITLLYSNLPDVRRNLSFTVIWGGSRGDSGGSVEPPKLNVRRYSNTWLKKNEPTQLINIAFENDISLCLGP